MSQTETAVTAAPPHFAARMRVFYAGFFLFGGVTVPFFPVWLQSRGLNAVEIADVIAIPALIRVFLTPIAGIYADRAPSRRFATITFAVPAALIFLFAWRAEGFLPLLIITGLSFTIYALASRRPRRWRLPACAASASTTGACGWSARSPSSSPTSAAARCSVCSPATAMRSTGRS